MAKLSREEVLHYLNGSPDKIGEDLATFTEAAKVLSSDHPRLIDAHPMEWVGIYQGSVAAFAKDLDTLRARLGEKGIPSQNTIIRFIDKEEKTFLL
jgi:hypothetical protein